MKCVCLVCKKEFDRPPSVIKKGDGRFCSRDCSNVGRKKRTAQYKPCASCERMIKVRKRGKKPSSKFCNRKCASVTLIKKRSIPWNKGLSGLVMGYKPGDKHLNWVGGRIRDNYHQRVWIYKPDHPNANNKGYISEHRLVMEKKLGRYLERPENNGEDEVVHHINEIKDDNRIENLQVMTRSEHTKLHRANKIKKLAQRAI